MHLLTEWCHHEHVGMRKANAVVQVRSLKRIVMACVPLVGCLFYISALKLDFHSYTVTKCRVGEEPMAAFGLFYSITNKKRCTFSFEFYFILLLFFHSSFYCFTSEWPTKANTYCIR